MPNSKKALYNATHPVFIDDPSQVDHDNVFSANYDDRINYHPRGFSFSQSDFEDLIDNFTPISDMKVILNSSIGDLDKFCHIIYRMDFKDAFAYLSKRSASNWKKAFSSLARNGNQTALKIVADKFMALDDANNKAELKIVVCSDLPIDDGGAK